MYKLQNQNKMIKTKEFTLSVMLAVLTFLLPSTPGGEAALDWAQNGLNSVFLAYDYGAMDCDIISPSINDQFSAGESIYFNTSLTEGTYPFDSSTAYWTSDEEGTFLSATSGYASLTTPGYHGLTFYIQTTAGHYCSHGFDIEIIGGGATPPSCGVSFPSSGTSYSAGEQFTLGGNWYMGSYDVTDYWWTSSLEGTILSNSSFGGVTLSQNGTHTITFYVQDSQGQTCSDTIDVSISGGVENVEEDPNYDYFCNEGDVWWQNQFGEWTEIREYCSYGCTTSWTCDSSDEDPY